MMDSVAAFEARRHEIEPEVVEFFEHSERGGKDAIRAYGSVMLFHATHSSNAERIDNEGLSAKFEIIDPKDVEFAKELIHAVQSKRGYVDFNDIRLFEMLVEGKKYGQKEKGHYFHPSYPDDREPYNNGYGIPERLAVLTKEMAYVAGAPHFSQEQKDRASEIVQKYSSKILINKAEVVVFAADPFHGPIINSRMRYLVRSLRTGEFNKAEVLDILNYLNYNDLAGVFVPGSVSADALTRHGTMPLDQDRFSRQLEPKQSSMFYKL